MFGSENPIASFLGKITDIVILNILFILVSLPIFTIGAAWTALYYVLVKMVKNEESYVIRDFFKAFKQNFRQGTVLWLVNIIVVALYGVLLMSITGGSLANVSDTGFALMVVGAIVILAVMSYQYPMLSHYENTVPATIRNSILLSIVNLPCTAVFVILLVLPVAVLFTTYGIYLIPVILLVGMSGPAYVSCFLWRGIFAKLEKQGEQGEKNGQEEQKTE